MVSIFQDNTKLQQATNEPKPLYNKKLSINVNVSYQWVIKKYFLNWNFFDLTINPNSKGDGHHSIFPTCANFKIGYLYYKW